MNAFRDTVGTGMCDQTTKQEHTYLYFYLCEDYHVNKMHSPALYPNPNHPNELPDPNLNPILTPTLILKLSFGVVRASQNFFTSENVGC